MLSNRKILLGLIISIFYFPGCKVKDNNVQKIEIARGVSTELAQFRKKIISKVEYQLSFDIPSIRTSSIQAVEKISFELSDNSQPLQIDFKESKDHLTELLVNEEKSGEIQYNNEHIIISPKNLKVGRNVIAIKFNAGDQSLNRNEDYLYTLLVPERTRTFIPCFDQPDIKAVFTLTATVPKDWYVISNSVIKDSVVNKDRKTCSFFPSDTIPAYLFSMVAGKFQKSTQVVNNRVMNFYYRETDPVKIKESMDSIFELHGQALQFMENYTGISYPFKKFDFIAIPDFQYGGMEHVGAIDYRAGSLFLDKAATQNEKRDRAHLIAHETAHMWFGNLVSIKWFNDVWMKEVFANFMADKVLEHIRPDPENSNFRFLLEHFPSAYNVDRTEGSHPIRQNLSNLDEAGMLYGDIIYHKAPIVMRQLELTAGVDAMQRALRKYLNQYSFSNADWPDLINILDKESDEDIGAWNDQWINKAGRPVIQYSLTENEGKIESLRLSQSGEKNKNEVWKQRFKIAFVYPDSIRLLPIVMDGGIVEILDVKGWRKPLFLLFNATGEGYGSFPVDSNMLVRMEMLRSPVMRATACINLYEKTLDGNTLTPGKILDLYAVLFSKETEVLLENRMWRQFRNIYWQFLLPADRVKIGHRLEDKVWSALQKNNSNAIKRLLLQIYVSISLSNESVDRIYQIWKTRRPPEGITLTEDDYVTMAAELAIRDHEKTTSLLWEQLDRIKNPDRKLRFKFMLPALSNDVSIRDSFFNSLSKKENRKKEVWVTMALSYLHHPLRTDVSIKYLPASLGLLEEIQATGDIFFPGDWLRATLGNYQSREAVQIVRQFLQQHPTYNENLKRKILQEADDLFRAEALSKL